MISSNNCLARVFRLVIVTTCLFSVVSFGRGPNDNGNSIHERIKGRLNARYLEMKQLQVPEDLPEEFCVDVEHEGQIKRLRLQKHSFRGPNFKVIGHGAGGMVTEIDPGPVRTYLGYIEGDDAALVGAALTRRGLHASVHSYRRPAWRIAPLREDETAEASLEAMEAVSQAAGQLYAVYEDEPIELPVVDDSEFPSVNPDEPPMMPFGRTSSLANITNQVTAASTAVTGLTVEVWEAEIGIEVTSNAYRDRYASSEQNVLDSMDLLISGSLVYWLRDCQVKHVLGVISIRTDQATDPYDGYGDTSTDFLYAFRNIWNVGSSPSTTHDLAALQHSNGGGGLAWVGQVGTSYRYSMAGSNTNEGWRNGYIRHEIGHTWSLGHGPGRREVDRNGNQYGIMWSGSHERFTTDESQYVINYRNSRTGYLDPVTISTIAPMGPYGVWDTVSTYVGGDPVLIDVLANDRDTNNDDFYITGVGIVGGATVQGSVSVSSGTGPDGRDQVLYTPPATGVTGAEMFYYNIEDTTGQSGWGRLDVVLSELVKDVPGIIQAEDYDFGGQDVGYHDNTPGNSWNTYRDDDVDIKTISGESGYHIGSVESGEWLHYSLDVKTGGYYSINLRYTTPNPNQQIRLLLDGVELDTVTLPDTGAWDNWQVFNVGGYYFEKGNDQVFKIEMISPDGNYIADFDWMQFTSAKWINMNGDGIINLVDFSIFAACWQQPGCGDADFDGDDIVGLVDLSYIAQLWLQTPGAEIIIYDDFDGNNTGFPGGSAWSGSAFGPVDNVVSGLYASYQALGTGTDQSDTTRSTPDIDLTGDATYYLSCLYFATGQDQYSVLKLQDDDIQAPQILWRNSGWADAYIGEGPTSDEIDFQTNKLYLAVLKIDCNPVGTDDAIHLNLYNLTDGDTIPLSEPTVWQSTNTTTDFLATKINNMQLVGRGSIDSTFDNVLITKNWIDVIMSAQYDEVSIIAFEDFDGGMVGFNGTGWSGRTVQTSGEMAPGFGNYALTTGTDGDSHRQMTSVIDLMGDGVYYMSLLFKCTGVNYQGMKLLETGGGVNETSILYTNTPNGDGGELEIFYQSSHQYPRTTYLPNVTYLTVMKFVCSTTGPDSMHLIQYDLTNGDVVPVAEPTTWTLEETGLSFNRSSCDDISLLGQTSQNTQFDNILITTNWSDVAATVP